MATCSFSVKRADLWRGGQHSRDTDDRFSSLSYFKGSSAVIACFKNGGSVSSSCSALKTVGMDVEQLIMRNGDLSRSV